MKSRRAKAPGEHGPAQQKLPIAPFTRILVPIDFSRDSIEALRRAIALAAESQGTVTLLHVMEPMLAVGRLTGPELRRLKMQAQQRCAQELGDLADEYACFNVPITHLVDLGTPYLLITQFAARTKIDLIVIGSRGCTGLKRLLLGSVAERVVRHAHCPVLVVR